MLLASSLHLLKISPRKQLIYLRRNCAIHLPYAQRVADETTTMTCSSMAGVVYCRPAATPTLLPAPVSSRPAHRDNRWTALQEEEMEEEDRLGGGRRCTGGAQQYHGGGPRVGRVCGRPTPGGGGRRAFYCEVRGPFSLCWPALLRTRRRRAGRSVGGAVRRLSYSPPFAPPPASFVVSP